jgi:CO dehydrogenase maturation factor
VLALDSDVMPGMALTLGAATPREPALMAAAERGPNGRWRYRRGIGAVRAVQRFSYEAPDGVRLLELGKAGPEGQAAFMPAVQAFWKTVQRIGSAKALRDWAFVGDLPAGPRQVAYDWAPYAHTFLLVAEPTMQSLLTARRIARVVSMREGPTVTLVASKVKKRADLDRIESFFDHRATAVIPLDPAVVEAERLGVALIDHAPDSAAVRAIAELATRLRGESGGR